MFKVGDLVFLKKEFRKGEGNHKAPFIREVDNSIFKVVRIYSSNRIRVQVYRGNKAGQYGTAHNSCFLCYKVDNSIYI